MENETPTPAPESPGWKPEPPDTAVEPAVPQATLVQYLKSKEFWATIGSLALLAVLAVLLLFYAILPVVTSHNASVEVPNVRHSADGKTVYTFDEAKAILEDAGLRAVVLDSTYVPELPPLAVVSQNTPEHSLVKPGREIALRLNRRQPPLVKLPPILNANIQQARYLLTNWELKMGDISYVSGSGTDLVLRATYRGQELAVNQEIPKGSRIDLVVSTGLTNQRVFLPNFIDLTLDEAKDSLAVLGLSLGRIKDVENVDYKTPGIVIRQDPEYRSLDSLLKGTQVNFWISKGKDQPQEGGDSY